MKCIYNKQFANDTWLKNVFLKHDAEYFIWSVFERFKVDNRFTIALQHQNAVLDSEQEWPIAECILTFFVIPTSFQIHSSQC